MTTILGIKLNQRAQNSIRFQELLSQFGCSIRTRLGLHGAGADSCSPFGIILIEVVDDKDAEKIEQSLLEIDDIEIQKMVFN